MADNLFVVISYYISERSIRGINNINLLHVRKMSKLLFQLSDVYLERTEEELPTVNYTMLLGEICLNRVAGIAYKNVPKITNLKLSREFRKVIKSLYISNVEKTNRFIINIKYLGKLFQDADFDYAFLKGAFLTTKLYEIGFRTSNDIDILVNECDISKCQNILLKNGFVQGVYREGEGIIAATRREVLMARMNFGETIPFVKLIDGEPLDIDINFSVDFKPENEISIVAELLKGTEDIVIDDTRLKTLNRTDFLIHLCCHLYKEATTINWIRAKGDLSLYKFSDINVYLNEFASDDFFSELLKKIQRYRVEKECYYTFTNAAIIYPNLKKVSGFNEMKNKINIKNLRFMRQIYDPDNRAFYEYDMDFEQWFECNNRIGILRSLRNER